LSGSETEDPPNFITTVLACGSGLALIPVIVAGSPPGLPTIYRPPDVPGDRDTRISELLHEAAETHHTVYRITDGDDPDWASWYASWLLDLSELPELLGGRPVRSQLVHALVELDREYTSSHSAERWEDWYAERLAAAFAS
jgi:hypothetical protein